jgi:hypothetical protein
MTVFMAIDGQPLALPLLALFGVALAVSGALAWVALRTRPQPRATSLAAPTRKVRPT